MYWYAWALAGLTLFIFLVTITRGMDSIEGLLRQILDELVKLNFKNEERADRDR